MSVCFIADKESNRLNITNPKIIAKYVKNGQIYSIPSFGI